jgi:DNA sulfur modification protein DndD
LQEARDNANAHRAALREIASGVLPLALIQPLLQQAEAQAQQEVRQQQWSVAKEFLEERSQKLLQFVKSMDDACLGVKSGREENFSWMPGSRSW